MQFRLADMIFGKRWPDVMVLFWLLMLPGGAIAEPWPIKNFEVIGVAATDETRDLTLEALAKDVQRLVQETGVTDPYFPSLFRTQPVDASVRTAIENYLREAANLYEKWGFRPPALKPVVENSAGNPTFRVYLISNIKDANGEYHPSCTGLSDRIVLLDRGRILDGNSITTSGYSTIAHELFHAVQYSYPFFECGTGYRWVGNWITEGQASAVGWDTANRLRPLNTNVNATERWGHRNYNQRLQVPKRLSQGSTVDPYGTSSFWRYLAEREAGKSIGQKPGPEEAPVDYSYLPTLLNHGPIGRDCSRLKAPCDAEVDWLNAGLLTVFGADLRTIYTNFAEAMTLYDEHRSGLRDTTWEWHDLVFPSDDCHPVPFGAPYSRRIHRDVVPYLVENSIQCFVVTFEGFDNDVLIEFKATAPPGGTDIGNLNFSVAGRPIEARRAQVKVNSDTRELTVAWVVRVPSDEKTYLTITNVADIPSKTGSMRNLPYTVTVLEEFAEMGLVGGKLEVPEIAQTLPIELDSFDSAFVNRAQYRKVDDRYVGRGVADGIEEPCYLAFQNMHNSETLDFMSMSMMHAGPITPGEYEFANRLDFINGIQHVPENKVPGMVLGGFGLGPRNPDSAGQYKEYYIRAGTLTIESISGSLIRGHARAYGKTVEWSEETRRKEPKEDEAIAFRFLIDVKDRPGLMYTQEPYACLLAEAPVVSGRSRHSTSEPRQDDHRPAGNTKTKTRSVEKPPGLPTDSSAHTNKSENGNTRLTDSNSQASDGAESRPGYNESYRNRFYIKASGDVEYEHTFIDSDFEIFGGCTGTSEMSTGFVSTLNPNPFRERDELQVMTSEVVALGATGTYPVRILWGNGSAPPPGMPADTPIRLPRHFDGDGELKLTKHLATQNEQHMQGTIKGLVKQKHGELTAAVFAEFDLMTSCGRTRE